ncbi:hypothetical protein GCM10027182_14520 [Aquaspirillum soli]
MEPVQSAVAAQRPAVEVQQPLVSVLREAAPLGGRWMQVEAAAQVAVL